MRPILVLVFSVIVAIFSSCKTEEIILHGEISGFVTDTITSQPIQAVPVKLNPINDTTSTGVDGKYLFKSLIPGNYKIEVSKPPFSKGIRNNVAVTSANTTEINFALHKIQHPEFSEKHLDFGFDSTSKSFTIRKSGTGKLNYSLLPSQDWITVNPNIGEATTETDTFKVTINRTGLSEKKHVESIEIVSHVGKDLVRDTVYVLLNGVMDQNKNYYGIVTIGTQTWLKENLNTGVEIPLAQTQTNNDLTDKWCYDCKTYGGLYTWHEAMQYNPADDGIIGTTQGICPVGWHIPTPTEGDVLYDYLEHYFTKLVESGFAPLTGGWAWRGKENDCANPNPTDNQFFYQGLSGGFWTASSWWIDPWPCPQSTGIVFIPSDLLFKGNSWYFNYGLSVRCIKDPAKK